MFWYFVVLFLCLTLNKHLLNCDNHIYTLFDKNVRHIPFKVDFANTIYRASRINSEKAV